MCLFFSLSFAQTDFQRDDTELSDLIQRSKKGIVAIAPIILPSPTARIINGDLIKHLKKPFDIFQIDGTAYPGNSGSPVYRIATGEVVGVINMVFIKSKKEHVLQEPTGITYAIPIKFVHELNQSIQ